MSRSPDPARRELWQERMDRYHRGQLSVTDFCQRERISTASFYQWRKKLDASVAVATRQPRTAEPKFVPVVVTVHLRPAAATLRLPGGATIDLPASLEREQLAELFAACIAAGEEASR